MYVSKIEHFINDLYIPNLKEECIKSPSFSIFLAKTEIQCLNLILGNCLATQLIQQFELTNGVYTLKENVDLKWVKLLNGNSYSGSAQSYIHGSCCNSCSNMNCDTLYWKGLLNTFKTLYDGTLYLSTTSLISHYVYSEWAIQNATHTTGAGEQLPNVHNSVNISNRRKSTMAFNKFVSMVITCTNHNEVGLYKYLSDHKEEFGNWNGVCLSYKRIL